MPRSVPFLRPVHTLQNKEKPSSTTKPNHVSLESSATQIATSSSTLNDTRVILAELLQGIQIPAESVRFMQLANPRPQHTVCFEPSLNFPLCLSSSPILASRPSVWIAIYNLHLKLMILYARHRVGTVEAAEVVGLTESPANSVPMSFCVWCRTICPRYNSIN